MVVRGPACRETARPFCDLGVEYSRRGESSHSSAGKRRATNNQVRPCPFCKGSGRCNQCGGKGIRKIRGRWFHFDHVKRCRACDGTGKCQLCVGRGQLGTAS
jgi:hypothetical protein